MNTSKETLLDFWDGFYLKSILLFLGTQSPKASGDLEVFVDPLCSMYLQSLSSLIFDPLGVRARFSLLHRSQYPPYLLLS